MKNNRNLANLQQYLDGKKNRYGKLVFNKWYYRFNDKLSPVDILTEEKREEVKKDIFNKINEKIDFIENSGIQQILTREKTRYIRATVLIAATILLLISTGFYILLEDHFESILNDGSFTEIIVPKGEKSRVTLPDGSKVWLNSDTKFRYNTNFKRKREVFLDGEAYFDITKHDNLFTVKTSHISIKVYGTAFNVKSNREDNIIETTLVRGKISIEEKEERNKEVVLKPNQKFTFYKQKDEQIIKDSISPDPNTVLDNEDKPEIHNMPKKKIVSNIDTEPHIAWKENKLVFRDETFEDIAIKMERWYDIKIHFQENKIRAYKYRGTFENETINQALDALKLTTPFQYMISHRDVYISIKN